ncbi:MAG: tripartite tricarboxylate transporter substrate binding protein [Betaproteobacteria bacterium]|nr:tripartite tricarboxylate transporter substrate binding protein [Betaproteobacteria bacterium]MDE2002559.1 tripartite tricarboxylate transporter substrate binding protein [Betaproteobacteria bacterium]MDE2210115.1 tripartite tricarboxylate transporter substrate binding protein [Betaproteobacteria bacterium]MDE2360029.1 tripartite tricarboxylate transporter substrate binding protein [Betaproteobacteria bacterium]
MIRRIASALVLIGAFAAAPACGQENVVHLVVAFPAGGPTDFVARTISGQLGSELHKHVIVENKPGGNGAVAAEYVARATPDGTTIWLSSVGAVAINPVLYSRLAYDVADLAPVSLVVNNNELLVVNPANPAKSAAEFVANARKASKPVAIASTGIGSIPHLAMEQLAESTKVNFLHVPYKGAAPAITDLLGGQVQAFFGDVPGLIGQVRGGKLRAIGIAAPKRNPELPNVPTLAEQGLPGVDTDNWYGLFVSAKTPAAAIKALNEAARKTLASAAVRDKLLAAGAEPASSTPRELEKLLVHDTEKWGTLIKAKHISPEG